MAKGHASGVRGCHNRESIHLGSSLNLKRAFLALILTLISKLGQLVQ